MTSMPQASIFSDKSISVPSIPANNQELGDEITRLAGHINAAQYRFLKLLAALIERNAWGGDSGMKSPAQPKRINPFPRERFFRNLQSQSRRLRHVPRKERMP